MVRATPADPPVPLAVATTPVESDWRLMAVTISLLVALAGKLSEIIPSGKVTLTPLPPIPGPAKKSCACCADCETSTVTGMYALVPKLAPSTVTSAGSLGTMPLVT